MTERENLQCMDNKQADRSKEDWETNLVNNPEVLEMKGHGPKGLQIAKRRNITNT
jgi:hypothetical protein